MFEIAKNVQGLRCWLLTITFYHFNICHHIGINFPFFFLFLRKRKEISFFFVSLPLFSDSIQSFILLLVNCSVFNIQSTLTAQGNEKKGSKRKIIQIFKLKMKCILFSHSFFNCNTQMHTHTHKQYQYVKYVGWIA